MRLIYQQVEHLARLARFALTLEEIIQLAGKFIVNAVNFRQLQAVNTNEELHGTAMPCKSLCWHDITKFSLSHREVQINEPAANNQFFLVPKVID
ncbi:MAG: hypothetical protein DRP47_03355 [Candidatus Zixiibacteriota bacterium]|nr:MAG: hypothetical protein DRP47_03355 [candidate division Zixibacteria bacterium]